MTQRLQDWLTLQAEKHPEACAAVFHPASITYGRLEAESNRLARALIAIGCGAGDRIALLLPKSIEALIAMFGSIKAGCTYVPIDTASPAARIARILEQCESRCMLAVQSTSSLAAELALAGCLPQSTRLGWMDDGPESGSPRIDFTRGDVRLLPASPPPIGGEDPAPAHILFTSGSTGLPKGVVITHANVMRFIEWALPYFGIDASDRMSCHPPLHFDLSMFDVYGAVAAGAELHLLPPELNLLPHRLAAYIRDKKLTHWFSVPSMLHHMAKSGAVRENDFPELKRVLWCGERFPTPGLMHWMRRVPHAAFYNLYGPTEATIASSYYQIPRCPEDEAAEIPIGDACAGEKLWVLDEFLRPLPPGQTGELYIAGVGLSPGYWRDPEKTAQVFLRDPFSAEPGARIYKTGDLARWGEDGQVYLLGRADTQIKSRGYRIELGEIESAIHALAGVRDAAVVAIDTGGFENTTICCAYVSDLSPAALKRKLAEVLPQYMLPSSWLALERMPLNGNGKADRPLLKEQFHRQALTAKAS